MGCGNPPRSGAPQLGLPGSENCPSMKELGACSRAYGGQGRRREHSRGSWGRGVQSKPRPTLTTEALLCLMEQRAVVSCPYPTGDLQSGIGGPPGFSVNADKEGVPFLVC